jgi:hypothetical protein
MKHQLSILFSGLLLANAVSAATLIDLRHQPMGLERSMAGVQLKQTRVDVDFNQTFMNFIENNYEITNINDNLPFTKETYIDFKLFSTSK